ncbi:MAG: hypothetical protein WC700_10190 [Gemmatimonadaceae bacterium]|jgi:hypothetical protein
MDFFSRMTDMKTYAGNALPDLPPIINPSKSWSVFAPAPIDPKDFSRAFLVPKNEIMFLDVLSDVGIEELLTRIGYLTVATAYSRTLSRQSNSGTLSMTSKDKTELDTINQTLKDAIQAYNATYKQSLALGYQTKKAHTFAVDAARAVFSPACGIVS